MTEEVHTTMPEQSFTLNVAPDGFDGLFPVYELSIYRMVKAGVCGPFTGEPERVIARDGLAAVDRWLHSQGFVRVGDFGPVCANGFASAPVILKD